MNNHSQSTQSKLRFSILFLGCLLLAGGMVTPVDAAADHSAPTTVIQSDDCAYNPRRAKRLHDGRVGNVLFHNTSATTLTVKLYHPDGDGRVFATWTFKPNETSTLWFEQNPIVIGSDWGIQVEDSCVYLIKKVSGYQNSSWVVRSSDIE